MNNQPWDKFVLLAVSVAVIALSAFVSLEALGFGERFAMESPSPNDELPDTDVFRAETARNFVEEEKMWTTPKKGTPPKDVRLFVSIPIVESDGTLIDMSDPNAPKLRPPVSNAWLISNNLDFLNAGVLSQDPDDDGFDNRAEWEAKTSPRDADSHPPYADKLRMVSRQQTVYKLRFAAQPDSDTFQIIRLPTRKWPERKTFLMEEGETSEDEQFRIESFEQKSAQNNVGIEVDASVLGITYLPKQETYELVRNLDLEIPTYYAELEFLLDPGETFYVKEGETFNLVQAPNTKYRVVEVKENSAIVTYQTGSQPEQTVEIEKK